MPDRPDYRSMIHGEQSRRMTSLVRELETHAEECVRGTTFGILHAYIERGRPEALPRLFEGFPAPYTPKRLLDGRHGAPIPIWREYVRRFEQIMNYPEALYDAGRALEDIGGWGMIQRLRNASAQLLNISAGYLAVPTAFKAAHTEHEWRVVEIVERHGLGRVLFEHRFLSPEDADGEPFGVHWWLGLLETVPRIWGQPFASARYNVLAFDIFKFLAYYQERCRFFHLVTQIDDFRLDDECLLINGQVYGHLSDDGLCITRDLPYSGPLFILQKGQRFKRGSFEVEVTWKPLRLNSRLRRAGRALKQRLRGKDTRSLPPSLEYAAACNELVVDVEYFRREQERAASEAERLRRMESEARFIRARELAILYETKDGFTYEHVARVARRAVNVGRKLGIGTLHLTALERGAYLHDIGKIGIPDSVLGAQRGLTDEEFAIMKKHTLIGAELAADSNFEAAVVDIIRHHHEKLDGSGYPDGLTGDKTSLEAQIVDIVDIWDALTNERQYKKAIAPSLARIIMQNEIDAGRISASIVNVLMECLTEEGAPTG